MTITREEAIDVVKVVRQYLTAGNSIFDTKKINETMRMAIEALSEQPQGKWEYCEHEIANHVDGYKCSNCGFFVPWDYMHKFINFIEDYNFCPSCGARIYREDGKGYELATEQMEHDVIYEPTYNSEDGSM